MTEANSPFKRPIKTFVKGDKDMEGNKVIGAKGLAKYILDNLESIKKGCTVDFCADTYNDAVWFGVALCKTSWDLFDSPYTVLYLDYYGGSPAAKIVTVDEECLYDDIDYLADSINEVLSCDGYGFDEDEEIHAEVQERH